MLSLLAADAVKELKITLYLSWPEILSFLCQYGTFVVQIVMIGHIGSNELAAVSLGAMFVNVTGLSVGSGIASALDTLCSQAFGAGDRLLVGILLQRGLVVMALLCVPVVVLWWNAGKLLLFAHQDPTVVAMSVNYIRIFSGGVFPALAFDCLKRALQSQQLLAPIAHVSILVLVLSPLVCYLLIFHLQMGVVGAAIAAVVCQVLLAVLLLFEAWYTGALATFWGGWSSRALEVKGLVKFLKLVSTMYGYDGHSLLAGSILNNSHSLLVGSK
jgi:MATE family multidrug resistance protein